MFVKVTKVPQKATTVLIFRGSRLALQRLHEHNLHDGPTALVAEHAALFFLSHLRDSALRTLAHCLYKDGCNPIPRQESVVASCLCLGINLQKIACSTVGNMPTRSTSLKSSMATPACSSVSIP